MEPVTAAFTSDAKRVHRLQANAAEGYAREQLPLETQRALDVEAMRCTPEHIANLRKAAGLK